MKILFDHNLPRRLREHLPGNEIRTTREMKWEQLRNGALMSIAAASGFEVFVRIDKQIEHQQNLPALALAVVIDVAEHFRTPDEMAAYLETCFESV